MLPVDFGGATCTTNAAGAVIANCHNPADKLHFVKCFINLIPSKLLPRSFNLCFCPLKVSTASILNELAGQQVFFYAHGENYSLGLQYHYCFEQTVSLQ